MDSLKGEKWTDADLMPFGQYKGKALANVPASYLLWLYNSNYGNGTSWPELKQYIIDNMGVLKQQSAKKWSR